MIWRLSIGGWRCWRDKPSSENEYYLNQRLEPWNSNLEAGKMVPGGGVRCPSQASSSLKTPAIPPFYKIITDNQSTKLVYNLVYRKFQGSSIERRGYWSRFLPRFGCLLGVGTDNGARLLRLRPWFWDWRRWWRVIVFERLLFLWTEGNGKTSVRRIARGLKTSCHSYHSFSKPNQIWQL